MGASSEVLADLAMAGYSANSLGQKKLIQVKDNAMICCVFHQEDTPSLSIGASAYYCFGCGASGTFRKLRAILLPELYSYNQGGVASLANTQSKILNGLNMISSSVRNVESVTERNDKLSYINSFEQANMGVWKEDWRGLSGNFLESVGAKTWLSNELNTATGELWQVPRIYFPFKHPKLRITIGYAARRLDESMQDSPKYRNSSMIPTKQILYLYQNIQPRSPIVIVEGAVDALKLQYYGIPAVASLGTNQWSELKTRLILAKRPSAVIIMGDGDDAGRKFNNSLYEIFKYIMPSKVFVQQLPDGVDPGDFDQAWIDYIYSGINTISNGYLERARAENLVALPTINSTIIEM